MTCTWVFIVGPDAAAWSWSRKALFRLGLLYFALHLFPYPLSRFGFFSWLTRPFHELTGSIVHQAGLRLLSLPEQRYAPSGCGDRADNYLGIVFELALALLGAALWSWLDRRRPHYQRLQYWATVVLRYYVAGAMLQYGIIKIFKSQFPFPGPGYLATQLGDLPAMRVLWMAMGISTPYCVFLGLCEFLGGTLLFFRRTVLAGALLTTSVLVNVVLINVFFGVCVKLYSAHLLLLTALLLVPDARRLVAVVLGGAAPARERVRPHMGPRLLRALFVLKLLVVSGMTLHSVWFGYGAWRSYGDAAPTPPLYGLWDVESFARNGQPIADDGTDARRWSWLGVNRDGRASLQLTQGPPLAVRLASSPTEQKVNLLLDPASSATVELRYSRPQPEVLELDGELDGAPTFIRLKQRPLEQFQLTRQRFRWTSDL